MSRNSWADDADFEEERLREKMPHMFGDEPVRRSKYYYKKPKVKKPTKGKGDETTNDKRD